MKTKIGKSKTILAFVALLAFFLAMSLLLFPPWQPMDVTGPYTIGTERYTYTDEKRTEIYSDVGENRQVNVVFWYPEGTGDGETYPLVVFSHGGLGTENSNESLYRELASHGYVVGAIGHPYHAFWTKSEDGRTTFVSREYFNELQREDAGHDKEQSFRYYQSWMEIRTADINFVLDTILARVADGADGLYALVDGARIGVMGHSLGGSAALAIPRQRDDVVAVIALESPFFHDIIGVENGEFLWLDKAYPVPVLNVYSDSSWSHLSEWPQYARNAALLTDAPETAVSLHLPGAGHFSLTDLALVSPLLTRLLEGGQPNPDRVGYLQKVNRACLEFFNRYLKNPAETVEIQ
jgi:dienelactone hydrolase